MDNFIHIAMINIEDFTSILQPGIVVPQFKYGIFNKIL
jgi:hypothetical protein